MATLGERRSCCMSRIVTLLALMSMSCCFAAEAVIDCVKVAAKSENNPIVTVWYRVPRNYDKTGSAKHRVLVLFGGRNCDGKPEVSGKLGWTEWADLNGIFLVSPTLKDDVYWEPEKWSGRALLSALDAIALKYRISKKGLLYYGYSAGSQASNLFPAWRPDLCRAYVSHACGVFHEPSLRMKNVAGLVTCGDADIARYVLSRDFVGKYRKLGISVIWRSFPNHPHDVPPGSIRLAQEFLAHYHWKNLVETDGAASIPLRGKHFVGDDADGVYYPADSSASMDIMDEDKIVLPSLALADAWGRPGRQEAKVTQPMIETNFISGIEVVARIPYEVRQDSRILVLLGGRGWSGMKTINETGFSQLADRNGWCLLSPSFLRGKYWELESGSLQVLISAIESLRRRYALRPLPVFMFGYSAGAQLLCAILSQTAIPIAAWGVYGCGVYPDKTVVISPGVVVCGDKDSERFQISREFVYRYREAGGLVLWKPVSSGHELNALATRLTELFFEAVASGKPCMLWGEDDTMHIRPKEEIDIEFLNPLHNKRLSELWRGLRIR